MFYAGPDASLADKIDGMQRFRKDLALDGSWFQRYCNAWSLRWFSATAKRVDAVRVYANRLCVISARTGATAEAAVANPRVASRSKILSLRRRRGREQCNKPEICSNFCIFLKNRGLTVRISICRSAMLAPLEGHSHALSHWQAYEAVFPRSRVSIDSGRNWRNVATVDGTKLLHSCRPSQFASP